MSWLAKLIAAGAVLAIGLFTVVAAAAQPLNFRAHLSGDEEVPPVDTRAQGQVKFQFNKSGDALSFKLIVANIESIIAAHIRCAQEGQNGPVGVTLLTGGPVTANGTLSEGTKPGPDPGNGCGWADLSAVVDAMQSGNAYVNVHTTANPPGEIRDQIH